MSANKGPRDGSQQGTKDHAIATDSMYEMATAKPCPKGMSMQKSEQNKIPWPVPMCHSVAIQRPILSPTTADAPRDPSVPARRSYAHVVVDQDCAPGARRAQQLPRWITGPRADSDRGPCHSNATATMSSMPTSRHFLAVLVRSF